MTPSVRDFVAGHMEKLRGDVLEVGAFDHNGNLKKLAPKAIRTDMRPGPNVDIVVKAEDLLERFGPEKFDAVLSTETMEHMEHWRECLTAMWAVLKPGGWLIMSMSSPAKAKHDYPSDYWRATPAHIERIFGPTDAAILGSISVCWAAQKNGPLPDLARIDLDRVK